LKSHIAISVEGGTLPFKFLPCPHVRKQLITPNGQSHDLDKAGEAHHEYAEGEKVGSNLTEFKAAIDLRQIKGPLDSATAFVGASRDGFNITLSEW